MPLCARALPAQPLDDNRTMARSRQAMAHFISSHRLLALGCSMAFAWALAGGLTGCLRLLEQPPLDKAEFGFHLDHPDLPPPPAASAAPVLSVRLFEAAPTFENQEFIYRLSALRWQTDYYHVFTQPPATLITFEVRRWMAHSGLFRSIAIPGLGPAQAWQIQGFLTQMYGDFQDPSHPRAVLHLRCVLLAPGLAGKPTLAKTYRQQIPLRVNSPEGLVDAWNEALRRILQELTIDVKRSMDDTSRPPAPSPTPSPSPQPFRLFPFLFSPPANLVAPSSPASTP